MLILLHVGSPSWAIDRWGGRQGQPNPWVLVEAELSVWGLVESRMGLNVHMRAKSRLSERGDWGLGGEGTVRWDFQNKGTLMFWR